MTSLAGSSMAKDKSWTRTRTKDQSGSDALASVFIDAHGKEAKIPESVVKRWELMAALQIRRGFNRKDFMDKMLAGYLMDEETTRKYIVVEGLTTFHKIQDILDEVHNRVVKEGRTLCEEELGMLTGIAKVSESITSMMESIIKISAGGKAASKGLVVSEPTNEAPNFYKQDIHVHVNGDKPNEKVIEVPPQENRLL